jgi:hypothetical protein
MMYLEGKEVDVLGAIGKGLYYRYFRDMKFPPIPKDIFDKSPRGKEEEV